MKRYIVGAVLVVGTLLFLSLPAAGQEGVSTDALLQSFTETINSHESIEMAFKLTFSNPVKGAMQNFEGTLLCSGRKYRLLTGDLDIYSDGRSKWLCNKTTNEVVAQYISDDEESVDITDNPLRFITAYRKDFKYSRKDTRTENGKTLVDIEFTPNDKAAAYTAIRLTLDEKTAYPHAIEYSVKDGSNYTILITNITPGVEVFDGYFAFPKHKYPNFELIDLR